MRAPALPPRVWFEPRLPVPLWMREGFPLSPPLRSEFLHPSLLSPPYVLSGFQPNLKASARTYLYLLKDKGRVSQPDEIAIHQELPLYPLAINEGAVEAGQVVDDKLAVLEVDPGVLG